MNKPPANLLAPAQRNGKLGYLNIPGKYKPCEDINCDKYIMCPFVRCQKCRTDMAYDVTPIVPEWTGCDCNGKYNTDTFKCGVCVVK